MDWPSRRLHWGLIDRQDNRHWVFFPAHTSFSCVNSHEVCLLTTLFSLLLKFNPAFFARKRLNLFQTLVFGMISGSCRPLKPIYTKRSSRLICLHYDSDYFPNPCCLDCQKTIFFLSSFPHLVQSCNLLESRDPFCS